MVFIALLLEFILVMNSRNKAFQKKKIFPEFEKKAIQNQHQFYDKTLNRIKI